MKHLLVIAALVPAGIVQAQATPAELAQDYAAAGFSRIEIKAGPTQTKVEAWSATTKIESIHDNATGAVLKSESEMLGTATAVLPGLSVRSRDKDFVDGLRMAELGDDKGGKGRGRGRDDGPGDDRGGKGKGRDDGPGDDRGGKGKGRDDGPGDDRGGKGKGRDDGPGDDRGGKGKGRDDGPGDDRGGNDDRGGKGDR